MSSPDAVDSLHLLEDSLLFIYIVLTKKHMFTTTSITNDFIGFQLIVKTYI